MPNLVTRILLFVSSYSPLLGIIVVRNSFSNRWVCVGLLLTALGSVFGLWLYLRLAKKLASHSIVAATVSSRDGEAMSYIVTYLLPFLNVNFADLQDTTSLAILLFVIGVVYINSNMIHINPILNLRGYHIFEVHSDDGKISALICKRQYIRNGSSLSVVSLGDYLLLEKKR